MDIERRTTTEPVEAREDATPLLAGYAALYDVPTTVGTFRERIAPGAFTAAIARDDVRALFNHNPDYVLGRTFAGTLTLSEDARGLRYQVALPDTTWARDLWTSVKRGDISQSSFAFTVDQDGDEWERGTADAPPTRVIRRVTLYDVSPVTYPAYAETTVSARALAEAVDAGQPDVPPEVVVARRSYDRLRAWLSAAMGYYGRSRV